MEHCRHNIERRKPKYSDRNLPQCLMSTTNPIWSGPGTNLGLRRVRGWHLSHGTASTMMQNQGVNIYFPSHTSVMQHTLYSLDITSAYIYIYIYIKILCHKTNHTAVSEIIRPCSREMVNLSLYHEDRWGSGATALHMNFTNRWSE